MDVGETQESSTMFSSNAGDASSSLPKMHSLVQCETEKYWEVESSGENWLRFIKASSGPIFEIQASSENEQDSNVSRLFASIASTEPRAVASQESTGMEMIIQLEVCFVTGIGHLLAVKAMEESHGALYSVEKHLPVRSRTLLAHRKLHLMRPGDKICYIQGGDELLMEYRCETVIETSDTHNLPRENLTYFDQTQESYIPMTQQDVPRSQDGMYLTQEPESERPYSQTSAMRGSNGLSKADLQSQQANQNMEVIDDGMLSQASSSGDTTVDPTEVRADQLPSEAIQSLKQAPESLYERETPISDDLQEISGVLAPEPLHRNETPISNEVQGIPGLLRETPINNEIEESPGLLAPTQPSDLLAEATEEQLSHPLLPDNSPIEKQSKRPSRRKRVLGPSVGSGHTGEEVTPLKESEPKPVRMTRSKTATDGAQPRSSGKEIENPRILVTGYEVDSVIEALASKIGGTVIHDLAGANTATHVVAKDLKRTIKLMIGLCSTNKIVTLDWLRASAENERPLPCNSFLAIDKKLSNRITKNLQKGKVLEHFTVYFCESVTKPPPNECRLLVEAAGGAILTDLSLQRDKSKNQLLIIRKGGTFSKGEKALCASCIDDGATVWTLDEFLTVMVTQSRL